MLKTMLVAVQTTAGLRSRLEQAGLATNVIDDIVAHCGSGRLLQQLGAHGLFDYLACQDTNGVVIGYNAQGLSGIPGDPFLSHALDSDDFCTRILTGAAMRLEAVLPFSSDDRHDYLLRVCISLGTVKEIEQRKRQRMLLFGGAMVLVTLLFAAYLLNIHTTRALSRERDEVTAEVERIQRRLRQQERASAMGRLAAAVAHEVRNPLNAVWLLLERLERETVATPETAAKFTEFIRVTKDEMKRLNKIVDDFVEFTRTRPPVTQQIDPAAIVRDVCCLEQGVLAGQGVTLRQEAGPCTPITADPQQITQALVNIVKNAREATPAGGEIAVRVSQDGAWTVFSVEDTGPGLSTEAREHAFDLYFTTKKGGSGIGLAVTRRIVEQHHGDIQLLDRAPHGTIVEMKLPTTTTP